MHVFGKFKIVVDRKCDQQLPRAVLETDIGHIAHIESIDGDLGTGLKPTDIIVYSIKCLIVLKKRRGFQVAQPKNKGRDSRDYNNPSFNFPG